MVSSELPAQRARPRPVGEEDAYDARGRARPIYGVRSPRPPQAWRPGRLTRLLMAVVPGVESLVFGRFKTGAPYTLVGLATLITVLLLLSRYATTLEALHDLRIQPRFMAVHAAAILMLVTSYELLRFGASLEEHRDYASRTPRLLAAFWLPAWLLVLGGPMFVKHAPRIIESAWFASLLVVVGATPAVAWCMLGERVQGIRGQYLFRWGSAATLLACVIILTALALAFGTAWATAAREAGFQVLPRILD